MVKRLIKTEQDYQAALARIDALMDAPPGSPEEEELEFLGALVEIYEERNYPMHPPSALAAIEFHMEQAQLTPRDLIPLIGSRALVSEILAGKKKLTLPMVRNLHQLGIPYEALMQEESPKPENADGLRRSLQSIPQS